MKIYIVGDCRGYGEPRIMKIFSSPESAQEYVDWLNPYALHLEIEERDVLDKFIPPPSPSTT